MTTNLILVLSIAAGSAILFVLTCIFFLVRKKETSGERAYEEQLQELINYNDSYEEETVKVGLIGRWNNHWGNLFQELGISSYSASYAKAGRDVFIAMLISIILISAAFKNIPLALLITVIATYAISYLLKSKANRKSDLINAQLPGFLNALKANIEANETPERSLLKIVDNMPSPLYDDLLVAKNKILANSTFKEALEDLSEKTKSQDLKFLCACMIQAISSGANIESQIGVIQRVLQKRKKASDEINQSVRKATPAIWVASVTIPGVFIYSLVTVPDANKFWFHTLASYAVLAIVIALYAIGVWTSKKFVDSIKNL